jgi:hypothetical protein
VDFDESIPAQSIETRPGPFVCLSVSDTGCGITSENLPRVFEPIRMELTEQQVRERDDGSSINLPKSGRKRVQTLFAGYKLHFAVTDFIFQPHSSEIAALTAPAFGNILPCPLTIKERHKSCLATRLNFQLRPVTKAFPGTRSKKLRQLRFVTLRHRSGSTRNRLRIRVGPREIYTHSERTESHFRIRVDFFDSAPEDSIRLLCFKTSSSQNRAEGQVRRNTESHP